MTLIGERSEKIVRLQPQPGRLSEAEFQAAAHRDNGFNWLVLVSSAMLESG